MMFSEPNLVSMDSPNAFFRLAFQQNADSPSIKLSNADSSNADSLNAHSPNENSSNAVSPNAVSPNAVSPNADSLNAITQKSNSWIDD